MSEVESMTRCASCGHRIIWAVTGSGKAMPVDPEPSSASTVTPAQLRDFGAQVAMVTPVGMVDQLDANGWTTIADIPALAGQS